VDGTGPPRILVAGIGNIFATDDGFGCAVVRQLAGVRLPDGVRVVDYGIRGMHLAYDLLEPWDALVLVDAVPDRGAPGTIELLEIDVEHVGGGAGVDAHGMDPATVLATLAALGGALPARTLLVGAQVTETGEGMGLTPPIEAAVAEAVREVRACVAGLQPAAVR
jgi:hydrogenase maturation protease